MPPAAAPAAANDQQQGQARGWLGTILQWVLIYFVMTSVFGGKKEPAVPTATTTTTITTADGQPITVPAPASASTPYHSFFPRGTLLDLRVLLSEDELLEVDRFSDLPSATSKSRVVLPSIAWTERRISLDTSDSNVRELYVEIQPTQAIINNGTVFAHVYLTRTGEDEPSPDNTFSATFRINRYKQRRLYKETKNLLSGEARPPSEHESTTGVVDVISYWAPNLTLNVVDDFTQYPRNGIPEPLRPFFKFHPNGDAYYPILFHNTFWLLSDAYYPINDTLSTLPLLMQYNPISLWKLMIYTQMEQSFAMQQNAMGVAEGETDEFKRVLLDTNPWILGLTVAVSLLHSVFDFLAFKNDISFWKNRENIEGLSVRTIFLNTICQLIIFLYLLDNETSFMVLISVGIGVLIEFWKISKACNVTVVWKGSIPTWVNIADRQSYTDSRTKEYDDLAFKYLSWALYPLLIGYAIYSLYFDTHKGWYSWILSSLTGAVYTFGFIMMTPQLFINYKLKSVAHLPWRVFAYKALNTFIDDLFAFIIKMPTMHRLACLRDDLVFFIYLYQRWIYPVDKSRLNEFGMSGEDAERIAAGQPPVGATADAATTTPALADGSAEAAPRATKKKSKPAVAATDSASAATSSASSSTKEDKKRK